MRLNILHLFDVDEFLVEMRSTPCGVFFNLSLLSVQAIAQGTLKCSFAGVALGDSWISPVGQYHLVFTPTVYLNLSTSL